MDVYKHKLAANFQCLTSKQLLTNASAINISLLLSIAMHT